MHTPTTGGTDRLDTLDQALLGADQFGSWWSRATWPSRGLAAAVLTAAAGVLALVSLGLFSLLRWVAGGLADIASTGSHQLAVWPITHVVTDPIRHSLAGVGGPADAATLVTLWAAACAVCWAGSLFGWRGARIGWAVLGAASTALVLAGTSGHGRVAAAAITLGVWAVLAIPAYWRTRPRAPRERVLLLAADPHADDPDED